MPAGITYTLTNLEDDIKNYTEVDSSVFSSSVLSKFIINAESRIYRAFDADSHGNIHFYDLWHTQGSFLIQLISNSATLAELEMSPLYLKIRVHC